MNRKWLNVFVVCGTAVVSPQVRADVCEPVTQLLSVSDIEFEHFGSAVGVSGTTVVVGAYNYLGTGTAYVYRLYPSGWSQIDQWFSPDSGLGGARFGSAVAIDGDVAVVGDYWYDGVGSNSGAAYVYRFDGSEWNEDGKLTASDAAEEDWFARSVSVSGDAIAIGALFDDDDGDVSGSAYIYRYNGAAWVQEKKLTASDAFAGDRFGVGVSIDGEVAVVGAYLDDDLGGSSGSAYVYRFDGLDWQEEDKLTASDGSGADYFGWSVAVEQDAVVIGAWGDTPAGSTSGSAYVFRFDGTTWNEEDKLIASDGAAGDEFGVSVALSGDTALVGLNWDTNGTDPTAAYLYRYDGTSSTWIEETKFSPDDATSADTFGNSVALNGDVAVVGAEYDDAKLIDAGSAYVFIGLAGDCNGNDVPDACDIAAGTSQDADSNGLPDECESCDGDANGDGIVDPLDSGYVLSRFGCDVGTGDLDCDAADVNGNGIVDPLDVGYVLSRFGTCD